MNSAGPLLAHSGRTASDLRAAHPPRTVVDVRSAHWIGGGVGGVGCGVGVAAGQVREGVLDPAWQVCDIPDVLYVDHGSDFTSVHLGQVTADLHIALVYSTIGIPQGRGRWNVSWAP